ncbi:MAG TPA: WhiB family transcriptional regulator [Candidatus Saccharimonadales bacterium]|nr:WhiB family transcriptional regulator [Candidatus Saccharimonadales bacterium]
MSIEAIAWDDDPTEDWHGFAACNGEEVIFDAAINNISVEQVVRAAKRICARCDVKLDCLNDALDTDDRFGIRAGLTPKERGKIADQRSRQRLRS